MQRTIEASVEKRTKNIFGPPVGKKLIAFVDDMNMPKVDNYGTQQPIALLKLFVENGGMYDRGKNLNWKIFKDICEFPIIQSVITFPEIILWQLALRETLKLCAFLSPNFLNHISLTRNKFGRSFHSINSTFLFIFPL